MRERCPGHDQDEAALLEIGSVDSPCHKRNRVEWRRMLPDHRASIQRGPARGLP